MHVFSKNNHAILCDRSLGTPGLLLNFDRIDMRIYKKRNKFMTSNGKM